MKGGGVPAGAGTICVYIYTHIFSFNVLWVVWSTGARAGAALHAVLPAGMSKRDFAVGNPGMDGSMLLQNIA